MGKFLQTKFELGQLVLTRGAVEVLSDAGESYWGYLVRHAKGDWGKLCAEDKAQNDAAISKRGAWLMSAYNLATGDEIWIITDGSQGTTTVLLPSEY